MMELDRIFGNGSSEDADDASKDQFEKPKVKPANGHPGTRKIDAGSTSSAFPIKRLYRKGKKETEDVVVEIGGEEVWKKSELLLRLLFGDRRDWEKYGTWRFKLISYFSQSFQNY